MPQTLPQRTSPALPASFSNVEELYTRYGRQAYALALKVLDDSNAAEVAVQEIFLRYWRQPGIYTTNKGPFLNWLLREIHCYCLDNSSPAHNSLINSPENFGPLSTNIIIKKAASAETTPQEAKARQVLAVLPQEQRKIVELAYFKGMNHHQIAQATGLTAGSVRQTLVAGLLTLKRGMSQLNLV